MCEVYRNRRARRIQNDELRVTVLEGGGHIAEIFDKRTGVNPLWTPPWDSIEPASAGPELGNRFGTGAEAPLLSGIMGHNLCLDIFGAPTPEEEALGMSVHGEASVVAYDIEARGTHLKMRAVLPLAEIRFERTIELRGRNVWIHETVESLCGVDRPIGWTQHVTLGPPFLEKGETEFRASATKSHVPPDAFGADDYLRRGSTFEWPIAPRTGNGTVDLRKMNDAPKSSAYTVHLMDPAREDAFFIAFSPRARLAFGYVWKRTDFPWLGIWEENFSRTQPPWNGRSLTRGMEFGVSPIPETRRRMVERGKLFGVPTFRWLPAKAKVETEYRIIVQEAEAIPEMLNVEL